MSETCELGQSKLETFTAGLHDCYMHGILAAKDHTSQHEELSHSKACTEFSQPGLRQGSNLMALELRCNLRLQSSSQGRQPGDRKTGPACEDLLASFPAAEVHPAVGEAVQQRVSCAAEALQGIGPPPEVVTASLDLAAAAETAAAKQASDQLCQTQGNA